MTNVTRLPGPIADVWDWQRLGLCRGRDSAQFFHPDGERGASRGRREASAKRVCEACPVRAACAAQALSTREPYGVWGGFTEAERLRLLTMGWEDAADGRRTTVDVGRLEARLGLRPAAATQAQVTARPVNAATRPTPVRPAITAGLPAQRRQAGTTNAMQTGARRAAGSAAGAGRARAAAR
jgi:WhiB family redox-sensing transcriptional regulator